ncbi:hypothetical protein L210DRAFT_3194758 [Boletus edulis BED1]|uniref:Uncharacterized protein n=1 Tax=Boletus edulis BED1 TaxID=1328754 RepID=A0AAD4GGA1_BOLED|nr:hypothetical protein L210DRAFT_3194758 [Boletus edulis BED1]
MGHLNKVIGFQLRSGGCRNLTTTVVLCGSGATLFLFSPYVFLSGTQNLGRRHISTSRAGSHYKPEIDRRLTVSLAKYKRRSCPRKPNMWSFHAHAVLHGTLGLHPDRFAVEASITIKRSSLSGPGEERLRSESETFGSLTGCYKGTMHERPQLESELLCLADQESCVTLYRCKSSHQELCTMRSATKYLFHPSASTSPIYI